MVENFQAEELYSLLQEGATLVDVRSPSEFFHGTIPGAVNVPLFSDTERAEIGTLYKQVGRSEALVTGFERVATKAENLIDQLSEVAREDRPYLITCWRGGMRSRSVGELFRPFHPDVRVLRGGFKAYRRMVVNEFREKPKFKFATLYGLTGSGKTELLEAIEAEGYPVIHLERFASHRGSVFGQVGIPHHATQIEFENLLHHSLWKLGLGSRKLDKSGGWVILEGESRRIGAVQIPDSFFRALEGDSLKIMVEAPFEDRVRRIVEIYASDFSENQSEKGKELRRALDRIEKRLDGLLYRKLVQLLDAGDLSEVTSLLLTHHYDKSYKHARSEGEYPVKVEIPSSDPTTLKQVANNLLNELRGR